MADEWQTHSLGDLTDNHDGKRKPVKETDRRPGPYPYYGASGIVDYVDDYLIDGDYLLIAEDGENLRTRQTPIAFMARGKSWVNNHAHIVTGNEKADTRFLMYALQGTDISGYLTGAVMPKLTQGNLNKIQIECPEIEEQRTIAHILGTLDDKIELNRRMNETLEAIARAMFKSWFVDFDPVRAKMNNEPPESICRRLGLTPDLLALFPDRLTDSELGEIPEGWSITPLPEVIDFLEGPGIRNWQYTEAEDGIKFINIRCIKDGDLTLDTASKITAEEAFGKYKHFQLAEDDIVVSISGTLGRFGFVRKAHLPLSLNTSVVRFRPISGKSTLYFIAGFTENQLQRELEIRASGSAQRNFGPMHLKQIKILLPPHPILQAHANIVEGLFRKRQGNLNQIDALVSIRDVLLPKLLSGELRVPQDEKLMEATI